MADPEKCPPLTRESVIAAHSLIKQYIHYTPVLSNTTLTDLASTPQSSAALKNTPWAGTQPAKPKIRLWFKCENLQKVGAFKVRGAFHALTRLMAEEGWESSGGRERGVVTHSSGLFQSSHLIECNLQLREWRLIDGFHQATMLKPWPLRHERCPYQLILSCLQSRLLLR